LSKEDLARVDSASFAEFVLPILLQARVGLSGSQTISSIGSYFLRYLLVRKSMGRLGERFVRLSRDMAFEAAFAFLSHTNDAA